MIYDYVGAFHIRSKYSFDGKASLENIVKAAKKRGLDFIVVSDNAVKNGRWEGWYDGVLVLKGGIGLKARAGTNRSSKGYEGISIWDMVDDWKGNLASYWSAFCAYVFPVWFLNGAKDSTLHKWDEVCQYKKVFGFGEIDDHNTLRRIFGINFKVFPFEYAFSTIRTHITTKEQLSVDFNIAKKQVFNALKSCRAYIAQEYWHCAKGFSFKINNSNTAISGDEIILEDNITKLEVTLPYPGLIKLIRNGWIIKEKLDKSLEISISRGGVYRVEVKQKIFGKYKPWIYSNPIWVIKEQEKALIRDNSLLVESSKF